MVTLTEQDLIKIAALAKLNIDKDSVPQYQKSLSNILNFVEHINDVNTDNVIPMAHPQELTQPLREDEVITENQVELLLGLASKTEANLYLVPKVIKK